MPPQAAYDAVINALLFVTFVIAFYIMAQRQPLAPRRVRKRRWFPLVALSGLCLLYAPILFGQDAHTLNIGIMILAGILILGIGSTVYQWIRKPTPLETLQNFAAAPTHCGRCDFDLHNNRSGACPKCGWVIPIPPLDLNTPSWGLWWRTWRIEHLRDWRNTLGLLITFAILFATLAVVMSIYRRFAAAVMATFMAIHLTINVVRVVSYGRRLHSLQRVR